MRFSGATLWLAFAAAVWIPSTRGQLPNTSTVSPSSEQTQDATVNQNVWADADDSPPKPGIVIVDGPLTGPTPEIDPANITAIFIKDPVDEVASNETASRIPSDLPSFAPTVAPSASPTSFPTIASNVAYYEKPKLKWSTKLEGTGLNYDDVKLVRGNAVTVSPDGVSVYVTEDNGSLVSLAAHDGAQRWSYTPQPLAPGWSVSSDSGVYFGKLRNGEQYVVWAVIDVPPNSQTQDFSSRVIAVTHPTNTVKWISDPIPGKIEGNPIITQQDPGLYVFFTHNIKNITTDEKVGSFTMLDGSNGVMMFTEMAGEARLDPAPEELTRVSTLRLPYTALGVSHSPEYGRYPGGNANRHDLLVWGTSDEYGRGDNGYTRAFQLPKLFEPVFAPALHTFFLRETRWNAIAAPTISRDGMDVLFGMRENGVRGWTGVVDFDKLADFKQNLGKDPEDERLPVPFSPVFSQSERYFFVTSTTGLLAAINTHTSKMIWNASGTFPLSAEPIVSHDDLVVYTTRENGVISAYDLVTGEERFSVSCADIEPFQELPESIARAPATCTDLIEARSSLSPNGLVLYYGDKFGNVKALQLGDSTIATAAPSAFPVFEATASPTIYPSASPTSKPIEVSTSAPSVAPKPLSGATSLRPTEPLDWEALLLDVDSASSSRLYIRTTVSIGASLLALLVTML